MRSPSSWLPVALAIRATPARRAIRATPAILAVGAIPAADCRTQNNFALKRPSPAFAQEAVFLFDRADKFNSVVFGFFCFVLAGERRSDSGDLGGDIYIGLGGNFQVPVFEHILARALLFPGFNTHVARLQQ